MENIYLLLMSREAYFMDYSYTLDKLVVVMRVKVSRINTILNSLRFGTSSYGVLEKDWIGHGIAGYHENLTVCLPSGHSYFFATRPNNDAPNEYWETCKVEFNPAKVGCDPGFNAFYLALLGACKHLDFKRFDVAIDIPIEREKVLLLKDIRKQTTVEYSAANKTTYLGLRASHGNVKLYNKQLESDLEYPMTRLEITLDYENSRYKEFKRLFPRLIITPDLTGIQGTDLVLCMACLEHDEYFRMLGRRIRKKIETLLAEASLTLVPDEVLYKGILSEILSYGNSHRVSLERFEELEDDDGCDPFPESFHEITGEQEEM